MPITTSTLHSALFLSTVVPENITQTVIITSFSTLLAAAIVRFSVTSSDLEEKKLTATSSASTTPEKWCSRIPHAAQLLFVNVPRNDCRVRSQDYRRQQTSVVFFALMQITVFIRFDCSIKHSTKTSCQRPTFYLNVKIFGLKNGNQ